MDVYSEEREQTSTSATSGQRSSTTTGASSSIRARARAYARAEDMNVPTRTTVLGARADAREEISLAYFESLGRDIPRYCQVIVDEMLDDGIEAAVICYGLHEAAKAPSPSWRYAAAVIARCVREGIRTAADLSTSQARAKSTARSTGWPQARKVREQMYTQREYQETDELPAWMQERIRQMHPQ